MTFWKNQLTMSGEGRVVRGEWSPTGMPVAPSCAPVGRNRSEAPAAPKRSFGFAEASVFCFAVALSARLRSNTLASPSSPPSFALRASERGASGEGG